MIHSRRDFLRALDGLGTGAAAARAVIEGLLK